MRRWSRTLLLAASLLTLLASPALAAANLAVRAADVRSADGASLSIVEKDRSVQLVAILRNSGDANHTGIVNVVFALTGPPGYAASSRVVTKDLTVPPNTEVDVTHPWTPTVAGKHQLRVSLQEQPGTTYVANFTVGEAEVERAQLWQRFVGYGWFYAAFLGLAVLFAGVVRMRKPRA